MLLIRSLILCLLLIAGQPCFALPGERLDDVRGRAELAAIEKLSETSVLDALRRLEALQANLSPDASYGLRRDMLRAEVWMREDAGQLELSYAADQKALDLAVANKDPATAAHAKLGKVRQLLDKNQIAGAQAALDAIRSTFPKNIPVMLAVASHSVQGDIFNVQGRFDKALASYLSALKAEESTPNGRESRTYLAIRIAQIYLNTSQPAKAVETIEQIMGEGRLPPRTTGRMHTTLGTALIQLGRDRDALAAFSRALGIAREGAMTGLEANVRGLIADYYLRQHDYVRAAEEARLALKASLLVKDENMIVMAKANLGFALMGQGKFAEGSTWVDGVIADLSQAGANGDLEAMLEEKGRMQESAGLYKEALKTVRAQQAVQLTSAQMARDKAIAQLQEEYAARQRTREIDALRSENRRQEADLRNRLILQLVTTFAAVLTVLAGAVVFVLYRRAARSNAALHRLNSQLEYHSMRDPLTGLHNRRSFADKMKTRAQNSEPERRSRGPASEDYLALLDIDHFKHINDSWGHTVGDAVLVEVARRLTAAVRDTDLVLRWGGEEFLIFGPGTNPARIEELIGRVLAEIGGTPVDAGSCMVPVTITAGVVTLPSAGPASFDWERAIQLADWALYQGKAKGRNQARIVTHIGAPLEAVLATLESSTGPDGLVELKCVRGPEPESAMSA